jgi:hypothetical protein
MLRQSLCRLFVEPRLAHDRGVRRRGTCDNVDAVSQEDLGCSMSTIAGYTILFAAGDHLRLVTVAEHDDDAMTGCSVIGSAKLRLFLVWR